MNSKAYKSYKISDNEYRELKYFCLRYPEMVIVCAMVIAEGGLDAAIVNKGIDIKKYRECQKNVAMIDDALYLAANNEVIRKYLRRSVTEKVKFENLDVPMGRQQFYELRRKFFYILKTLKMR